MSTSILREPVKIGFRGHERALPLAALALSFRRSPERTATALEYLIQGPPEGRPNAPSEEPAPAREDRGEGVGGGVRSERSETLEPRTIGSETFGSETLEQEIEKRSDRKRSERSDGDRRAREDVDDDELARRFAVDLADEANVAAIRKLVVTHPRSLLEQALRRALAVPADRIRASRAAIFTSIVRKLADEGSQPTP